MFITFEGIDGCGKTTQIDLLSEYLQKKGKNVVVVREPGGTDFSEEIRNILLNSRHEIHPVSELLLFEAARAEVTDKIIKPALKRGDYVLADRFFDSTTAYQGYGRGLGKATIELVNHLGSLTVEPDVTFYLEISLEISKQRSGKKIMDRIELAGDVFFEKVIKGYQEIAENNPGRVVRIDASKEIDFTRQAIIDKIEKLNGSE